MKNPNFSKKAILVKSPNFHQKSTFSSKIQIFVKNPNFRQNCGLRHILNSSWSRCCADIEAKFRLAPSLPPKLELAPKLELELPPKLATWGNGVVITGCQTYFCCVVVVGGGGCVCGGAVGAAGGGGAPQDAPPPQVGNSFELENDGEENDGPLEIGVCEPKLRRRFLGCIFHRRIAVMG